MLTVLVCHDGASWLRPALSALRRLRPRPRHIIAVDTGSTDRTPALLTEAATGPEAVLDGVLTLDRGTGFGEAVRAALDAAVTRWGDPGEWLWLLHDDCAPEPDCLGVLLTQAEVSPSVGLLGPLALDWADPRLVVEAGLSTDASGHRQTGLGPTEPDWNRMGERGGLAQSTEVLAVSSAGALVNRSVWEELGGYDPALPLLRDDLDFGWRVNRSGRVVLSVPSARLRHARAATRGLRTADAAAGPSVRSVDRAHGLRTLLVNRGRLAFVIGLPRLMLLGLLRAIGFTLLRRVGDARAELYALGYLLRGRGGLRAARAARKEIGPAGQVRGLLTTRTTRLRNLLRGWLAGWVRRRAVEDAALGRMPAGRGSPDWTLPDAADDALGRLPEAARGGEWTAPEDTEQAPRRPVGPAAVPAGAVPSGALRARAGRSKAAGLRRPTTAVVVPLTADLAGGAGFAGSRAGTAGPAGGAGSAGDAGAAAGAGSAGLAGDAGSAGDAEAAAGPGSAGLAGTGSGPSPKPRPSPVPRGQAAPRQELVLIEIGRGRILRQLLLAPPVLIVVLLAVVSLLTNGGRFGWDPSGGGLLPLPSSQGIWSAYLASWQGISGGTAASPPAALALTGVLGVLFTPLGGPPTAVAVLLFGDAPLAGLLAYLASKRLPVRREIRALVAAGYALLPPATAAVSAGRLDVVVAHLLLPPVLAGLATITGPVNRAHTRSSLLSPAAGTSIGIAAIGAFVPLLHAALIVLALAGFVAVPAAPGRGRRRAAALFAVVLMPLALLMPWPAVALSHPVVLLSGVASQTGDQSTGLAQLLLLDPGGPGAWWPAGLAVLILFVAALVLRPSRAMLPALGLVVLGAAGVAALALVSAVALSGLTAQHFWTAAPMLLVGCGLLYTVLIAAQPVRLRPAGRTAAARRGAGPLTRVLAGLGVLALLTLATGSLLAGRSGPLRGGNPDALSQAETAELSQSGRSVLVLAADGEPTRQTAGRMPEFGDDDTAPVAGSPQRLADWDSQLRSGNNTTVQTAIAQAVTAGVLFVVLPDQREVAPLREAAGDLVAPVAATSTGRPVLRLQLAGGAATLISEDLARRAVSGGTPPTELGAVGISPVAATPPNVALRVSEGAANRLLVLAAEDEPGWQATVNGTPAPVVRAWGHLVGVTVPLNGADIRIEQPTTLRDALLLVQAAAWLFAAVTAIPVGRRSA